MPAQEALDHIVFGGEDVAHIVKDGETETFSKIRKADRGKAELLTVHEQRCATDGKTGIRISGSCFI